MKQKITVLLMIVFGGFLYAAGCVAAAGLSYPAEEGVVIYDLTSGDTLYEQNADQQYYPASTTKLMTALVTVSEIENLEERVTVGNEIQDIDADSSVAGLQEGEIYSYRQLLYALLLPSGNDAANVLAVNVGRKIAGDASMDKNQAMAVFIEAMNQKAQELGCSHTHFVNAHGLHNPEHYTTPKDLMLIGKAAFDNDAIAETEGQTSYQITSNLGTEHLWRNSDLLLYKDAAAYGEAIEDGSSENPYYNDKAAGGKTGYTEEAGRTFVFKAQDNDHAILGVIMKTEDENGIFEQADQSIDWIYENYILNYFTDDTGVYTTEEMGNVHFGTDRTLTVTTGSPYAIALLKDDTSNYTTEIQWDETAVSTTLPWLRIKKDIQAGDPIGTLTVYKDGQEVKHTELYAGNALQSWTLVDYLYCAGMILIPVALIAGIIAGIVRSRKRKNTENKF